MGKLADWFDDRTGYRTGLRIALDEPVVGGASWAYVFGSVLTFILLMQAVTGVLLAMYYSPSSTDAWASVAYIQDQVTLGWFIRGLHSQGASAMVLVAGLHLLQTAIYGAYKKPREMNWLIGVVMLGVILAFALTGYLLPWDQKGYWATKVATGIMGSSPIIGSALQRAVQGGNEYGNLTLTRFFAIHVFILPATIFTLVAVHIILFRKHGVTPKWGKTIEELNAKSEPFWPDQLWKDMVVIGATFAWMVLTTWKMHGAELSGPADPGSAYEARPEWYFLPLFQMLKYFHGAMEQIAALGAPVVVGGVLVLLPFVDRGNDRSPAKRATFLTAVAAIFVGGGIMMVLAKSSDAGDSALQQKFSEQRVQAEEARTLAKLGVPPQGGTAVFDNDPQRIPKLFEAQCSGCHVDKDNKDNKDDNDKDDKDKDKDKRIGPLIGPGYGSRAWFKGFVTNPDSPAYFGKQAKIQALGDKRMKSIDHYDVTGEDADAVVEWLYAQSGAKDAKAELVEKGKAIVADKCSDCHSTDAESADRGPNLGEKGSHEWITAFLQRPDRLHFFGENNQMPVFKGKLSPDDVEALADWLGSLKSASKDSAPAAK